MNMGNLLPQDTTREARHIHFSILRRIGLEGRARMVFELNDNLRTIVEDGIRQRHPAYDDKMVKVAAIRLMIGEELFKKAYTERGLKNESEGLPGKAGLETGKC